MSVPGSALISALAFTVIIALALAGMGTLTVSHYNLAQIQAASSEALDLAEAGINYELYKLTTNGIASADDGSITYNASDIPLGLPGTFKVACGAPDPVTKQFDVTCTALIKTATGQPARRTVRIKAQPYSTFYTLYTATSTNFTDNGIVVNGISGTNGSQNFASGLTVKPQVKGIVFNGSSPTAGQELNGYNVVSNPNPLVMKKTTDYVNEAFPNGGENYIRQNNDNNLAVREDTSNPNASQSPAISTDQHALNASGSEKITLFGTGKTDIKGNPIPANYYLSDINMQNQSNLIFDNTKGPINIYYLRNSGGGSYMRGGHALVSVEENPANRVKLFMSAAGGINIDAAASTPGVANSTVIEMGIYNFDTYVVSTKRGPVNVQTGYVNLGNNVNFHGQITADTINLAANANIIGEKGYFDTPTEYYGFSGAWTELNSAGVMGGANQ